MAEKSLNLERDLLEKLKSLPRFLETRPVLLGSWARHELCLGSDIDLILLGPEDAVKAFSGAAQEQGLKLRYRMPEDPSDWTKGVLPFDVLALTQARPLESGEALDLKHQLDLIRKQKSKWAKEILRAIQLERKSRRERYDSMANYLQPNIKYGPGGLRDIDQVLSFLNFFKPEVLSEWPVIHGQLLEAKDFLLRVRRLNHELGEGDLLSAHSQQALAKHMGFKNLKSFMREIQIQLNQGSFFADGLMWLARRPKTQRTLEALPKIKSFEELFDHLGKPDPWLIQFDLRSANSRILSQLSFQAKTFFKDLLNTDRGETFWLNFYRSGLLDLYLHGFSEIKGLVQHDHYHRYTVDAHLVQALREVSRAQRRPKRLGHLASVAKLLTDEDWTLLRYAALFHDLGKGREEDHSTVGKKLVEEELARAQTPIKWVREIAWLVENHLILSTAAFRMNPADPRTWERLFERGVTGPRISLLVIFTAIDIQATNPEAWTTWKSQTMSELFHNLSSPVATNFAKLLSFKGDLPKTLLERLDPYLVEQIRPEHLMKDLGRAYHTKEDLPPLVLKGGKRNTYWVRFHRKEDRSGLFVEFLQRLYALGDQIQDCIVMTDQELGVYDWFCLRGRKTKDQVAKRLRNQKPPTEIIAPAVHFESIERVSDFGGQAIISFRGKNQRGLLLAAALALYEQGLSIVWVRAHTWGSQVDDSFAVLSKDMTISQKIYELRARFVT